MKVAAEKRRGELNFMSAMRTTLANHYGKKPVALGGMFQVEKGKLKGHVMVIKFFFIICFRTVKNVSNKSQKHISQTTPSDIVFLCL